MAGPLLSTALTANENIVTAPGAAGLAYPYAPSVSSTAGVASFADTSGGRLVSATVQSVTASTISITGPTGSVYILNRAAGIAVTLPTPSLGLVYDFFVGTTITSNTTTIQTSSSVFIGGQASVVKSGTTTPNMYTADGAANYLITMNGGTTGGIIGSWIRYTGVDATHWMIQGILVASGALATPIT